MNELTISVIIADRPYRLKINREEEEKIRSAANKINDKIKTYSESYAFNDKQDLLAMVALEEATAANDYDHKFNMQNQTLIKQLTDIESELTKTLE
ncbi:MAG: cell division protein ZapA [Bacteroidales bacterium]|nr:cell division protein ZapA [Bacteroidales bacterium]MCF8403968.1 cell division protein ZapA [Bacteroidales bacterium]